MMKIQRMWRRSPASCRVSSHQQVARTTSARWLLRVLRERCALAECPRVEIHQNPTASHHVAPAKV
eukprot:4401262-Amphidinium_carterae.1